MIPGVIKDKAWGRTMLVFKTVNVQVHSLEIRKGGYCSEHRHNKDNLFYVISGRLRIQVWNKETGKTLLDDTILGPGQITTVEAKFWHTFEGLEETRCIEIYESWIDEEDIERRSEGGLKE